jgi:hypothetical protein
MEGAREGERCSALSGGAGADGFEALFVFEDGALEEMVGEGGGGDGEGFGSGSQGSFRIDRIDFVHQIYSKTATKITGITKPFALPAVSAIDVEDAIYPAYDPRDHSKKAIPDCLDSQIETTLR